MSTSTLNMVVGIGIFVVVMGGLWGGVLLWERAERRKREREDGSAQRTS